MHDVPDGARFADRVALAELGEYVLAAAAEAHARTGAPLCVHTEHGTMGLRLVEHLAALHGEITIRDGRVEQGNFNDYPILRIDEAPRETGVHILPADIRVPPSGVGEPGVPPVGPARSQTASKPIPSADCASAPTSLSWVAKPIEASSFMMVSISGKVTNET